MEERERWGKAILRFTFCWGHDNCGSPFASSCEYSWNMPFYFSSFVFIWTINSMSELFVLQIWIMGLSTEGESQLLHGCNGKMKKKWEKEHLFGRQGTTREKRNNMIFYEKKRSIVFSQWLRWRCLTINLLYIKIEQIYIVVTSKTYFCDTKLLWLDFSVIGVRYESAWGRTFLRFSSLLMSCSNCKLYQWRLLLCMG